MFDGPRITYHHFKCYASLQYTTTLSSPTHIVILHSPIQFLPVGIGNAYTLLFSTLSLYESRYIVYSVLYTTHTHIRTKRPTPGKRKTTVNDGGDDSTYSHIHIQNSTMLLCAFNDRTEGYEKPKRYKAAEISFPPDKIATVNENGFRFCGNVFSYVPFQSVTQPP